MKGDKISASNSKSRRSSKCTLFESILKKAIWLKKQGITSQTYDQEILNSTIDDFHQHLESGCFCVIRSFTYIALATTYLERFHSMFQSCVMFLSEHESRLHKAAEEIRKEKEKNFVNDLDFKTQSSFIAENNDIINVSNFNKLIENLIDAVQMFEKGLQYGKTESVLNATFLDRFGILSNMNALFQIFSYYSLDLYAFRVVNLSLSLVDQYYSPHETQNENTILIQCNLLRILLKLGFVKVAASYYKRFFGHIKFLEMEDNSWINSFERCNIFLLYCELSLRNRNGKQISMKLKDFITSEYLQKPTIKRYTIKALAFSLASRFPSINYSFENFLNEFIEPTQMSVGMCRRWKFFTMFFPDNFNSIHVNDVWWIRFTVLNIFKNSFETFLDFNLNNGMNSDPVFYYKLAVNLFTVTMNIFSLGKLRLIGALYDIQNAFHIDAKIKMILFKRIFSGHSICNEEIFQISSKESIKESENIDNEINLKLNDLNNIQDEASGQDEDPNSIKALYKSLKQLINDGRGNSNDNEDIHSNFYRENIPIENLSKSFMKEFRYTISHLPQDSICNLFQLYILHYMISNMLIYEETKNVDLICKERYINLLNFFEHFTIKIYLPELNKQLKSANTTIVLKTTMEEQIVNGPIEKLFWLWNTFFINVLISSDNHLEALPFLNRLIDISTYSYSSRIHRTQMFYYRALVLYKQLKKNVELVDKSKKIFKLFTHHLVDNLKQDSNSLEKMSTPSPKNRKKVTNFEAPKKRDLLCSAAKEYKESLLEKIQSTRKGMVVTEGTRREGFKFDYDDLDFNDNEDKNESIISSNTKLSKEINHKKPNSKSVAFTRKKSDTDLSTFKNGEQFSVFVDDDCQGVDESLSQLFSTLAVNDETETTETNLYFNKLFNIDEMDKNYNLDSITNEDVKQCLKKAISYIGCHPSHKLYSQLHYLFYKLYKLMAKNNQTLCFHLAETASYHCFRYRLLFNTFKKINASKHPQYDIDSIRFRNEDFGCNSYMHNLPKTWRFVQIKLIENGTNNPDLLLCRFQNGYQPYFVKIKSDQQKDIKFFMDEFSEIMKLNSVSIHETEKKSFWRMRFETDFQLKSLLCMTERHVFGLAKGFFMGQPNNRKYLSCCTSFRKCILDLAKEMKLECQDSNLLNIFIESIVLFTAEEAEIAAQILFQTNENRFISQYEELRKKYFTTWMKSDKLDQLFNDIEPVGLIIDPSLNQFPFESLPSLRKRNQPFFRIPSVKIASLLYEKYKQLVDDGIDDEKTFYVLNPGSNLASTEAFFKQTFLSINEWTGFVGTVPDGQDLEKNFETKDIYVYMGHGSGSQYYRAIPKGFDVVNMNSLSIVVGCSSGRVTKETKTSDVFGSAYRFLINGAPVYIGTLWDVTDKDIDLYMDGFMTLWLPRWNRDQEISIKKNNSLCKSISLARDACKLRFLNGCASVVYGLPLKNQHTPQ